MVKLTCGWKRCFSWDYDGFCHAPKAELIYVKIGNEECLKCKNYRSYLSSPPEQSGSKEEKA